MELVVSALKSSNLLTIDDTNFLREHSSVYEKRFKTRALYRSKTEMEAGVLSDNEHPTPDSKYWQAIGEQNVQLTELINLDFETKKLNADMDLMIAEIEELQDKIVNSDGYEKKKLEAQLRKKQIEYEQSSFNEIQQKKVAQERMREVRTWEPIIKNLEQQLKYGTDDFELHHPERYYLRYKKRAEHINLVDPEAKENVISNYESFDKYFTGNDTKALPSTGQVQTLSQPVASAQIDYKSMDEATESDRIIKGYFDRKVRRILVCTPHRKKDDRNATNFNAFQPPAGVSCQLFAPYGFSVPDARNMCVKEAIKENADYIFFVDDDVIVPRTALVRLLKHNVDVVGGMYYRKYFPLETVGMYENENKEPSSLDEYKIGDIIHDSLVLPSGCTLIKTSVFQKMEEPWYKSVTVNGVPTLTEDTYVCQKFKDIGVDVITDTGIQCIHVDFNKGVFYGHPEIVDADKNVIKEMYRDYFAI